MLRRCLSVLAGVLVLFSLSLQVFAQGGRSEINGTISDRDKTDLPGVVVTVTSEATGLVRDVTRIPDRWQPGDTIYALRGSGAALVRFVWENARTFTLAHDFWGGNLDRALREATAWSGRELARVEEWSSAGDGVLVAAVERPDWHDVSELGTV